MSMTTLHLVPDDRPVGPTHVELIHIQVHELPGLLSDVAAMATDPDRWVDDWLVSASRPPHAPERTAS